MSEVSAKELISEYVRSYTGEADQFAFKPWQEERISPAELRSQVEAAFEQHGYWDTYGEFAMGGGPVVRIEPVKAHDNVFYLVTADHGISITGQYTSYEEGMAALAVLGHLVWHLSQTGVAKGLVWTPKPLPWPPGPR
jgi:hypothetical protein